MSSTIRTLSVLLTGAAFAGAAPPLFAQDSPGEQAQDDAAEVGDTALDEESSAIVVTGTRTPLMPTNLFAGVRAAHSLAD